MTEEKFKEYNNIFKSIIGDNDLLDEMTVIDGDSIISRIYKKINGKIDNEILAYLLLYNKHIEKEQYEVASNLKQDILNIL